MAERRVTIGYWKIRGLGQHITTIAEYAGVKYDLVRYEQGDDFNRDSWLNVKHTLGFDFPNLPYLIDGDFKLTETAALVHFICHIGKPELMGIDAKQKAEVEMIFRLLIDLKWALVPQMYGGDREGNNKVIEDKMPAFEKYLQGKQWFCGDSITYVDLWFHEQADWFDYIYGKEAWNEKYPNAAALHKRVAELPEIVLYRASERWTEVPFNMK